MAPGEALLDAAVLASNQRCWYDGTVRQSVLLRVCLFRQIDTDLRADAGGPLCKLPLTIQMIL